MRTLATCLLFVSLLPASLPAAAGTPARREARWAEVSIGGVLPPDLVRPEGRSRWDLTGIELGRAWVRVIEPDPTRAGAYRMVDRFVSGDEPGTSTTIVRPGGADESAPRLWLLPDSDPALLETAPALLKLDESLDGDESRVQVESRRVGVGWIHLPSGPHEVVLRRAVIHRGSGTSTPDRPDRVVYRWVDSREGVVAEAWGPASADGLTMTGITGAAVVRETVSGKAATRVYANELDRPPYTRLAYGYDRAPDPDTGLIPVSWLTADAPATMGDLIDAGGWDFSVDTLANAQGENASTGVEVSSDETCNYQSCGFTEPGVKLGREDRLFTDPANTEITLNVSEREDRATDVTIWLRAAVRNEGVSGGFGEGESRTCYVGSGLTEVPLWRFSHEDATLGWYLESGDTWSHTPFQCENNIFNHVCPNACGAFCPIYTKACGAYSGTQSTAVVAEGPLTLPSGHTFQAVVVRTTAEFCTYLSNACLFSVQNVRTVNYLWEVPRLGSVVRLESERNVADATSFTNIVSADVKYGLFPPLSVTAVAVDDDSVQVSWDPGLDTRRIDAFKIYWDTDSGASTDYANSVTQDATLGNSITIDGLAPGTEHFFTVTSLSDYANPSNPLVRTYESVRYPTSIPAVPNPLPIEVAATTTCTPQTEVTGVTVGKSTGGAIEFCWNASTDPCLRAYEILGADAPDDPGAFALVDEALPPETCRVVDPAETYFLIRERGVGAVGP